jgi:hypothetical protein
MEESLRNLRLLWGLLRVIPTGLVATASMLILLAIPATWWMPCFLISVIGTVAAILAVMQWKIAWIWVAVLVQAFLFTLGLLGVVYGFIDDWYVPILLLAFTMILASEYTLTTALSYSAQFSNRGDPTIREYNSESLRVSLNDLYRMLARNCLVLAAGFVLSVVGASVGSFAPAASILSDPSLYIVVASISLAALIVLKEEPIASNRVEVL